MTDEPTDRPDAELGVTDTPATQDLEQDEVEVAEEQSDGDADVDPDVDPQVRRETAHEESAGAPTGGSDGLDEAVQRLHDADPGDTQEVLEAGEAAYEQLQERLDETGPQ